MEKQTGKKTIYMYDGAGKPDYILDRFKDKDNAVEEQAKMAKNAEDRMNQALAELNKYKQGDETRKLVLGEKDETIEELQRQIAEAQKPTPAQPVGTRYNRQQVEQYCKIYGIYDEEGNPDVERGMNALDYMRGVQKFDRDIERAQSEQVLNTKQINKQWDTLVRDLGEEFVAERGPEIRATFKEYPEIVARAHRDEKALKQIVRIANAEYEESKAALEEEDEEIEREKLRAQGGSPGKLPAEKEKERAKYKGMSAREIAEEIGFANPADESQYV